MSGSHLPEGAKKEGDQAPGFTLENIDREEVALSEIPEENEIVLVIIRHRGAVLALQSSHVRRASYCIQRQSF